MLTPCCRREWSTSAVQVICRKNVSFGSFADSDEPRTLNPLFPAKQTSNIQVRMSPLGEFGLKHRTKIVVTRGSILADSRRVTGVTAASRPTMYSCHIGRQEWSCSGATETKMNTQIRELAIDELDLVSGGGFFDDLLTVVTLGPAGVLVTAAVTNVVVAKQGH